MVAPICTRSFVIEVELLGQWTVKHRQQSPISHCEDVDMRSIRAKDTHDISISLSGFNVFYSTDMFCCHHFQLLSISWLQNWIICKVEPMETSDLVVGFGDDLAMAGFPKFLSPQLRRPSIWRKCWTPMFSNLSCCLWYPSLTLPLFFHATKRSQKKLIAGCWGLTCYGPSLPLR